MNELKKLIEFIDNEHTRINNEWTNNENYISFNMKSKKVSDIYNDESTLLYIYLIIEILLMIIFLTLLMNFKI